MQVSIFQCLTHGVNSLPIPAIVCLFTVSAILLSIKCGIAKKQMQNLFTFHATSVTTAIIITCVGNIQNLQVCWPTTAPLLALNIKGIDVRTNV